MSALTPHQISILDKSVSSVLSQMDLMRLAGQRLFITGGTGFFGLWLLSTIRNLNLKSANIEVCVLSRDPALFINRHPQFANQSWLSFISGNIRNFEIPSKPFDILLHGATDTSMQAHAHPQQMLDDIFLGTRQVLECAQRCHVRRVLLISSGAVYGAQSPGLTHISDNASQACNPMTPYSAYGEGKRVMELMGTIFQHHTGIESISARCFTFSGPGIPLDQHFAIGNFIRDALYREKITVHGDGLSMRSYLHGADLAAWLLHLILNGETGHSYNVGSDEALSIKSLAHLVRDLLAPEKSVEILNNKKSRLSSSMNYVPSILRIKNSGCKILTPLKDSIMQTANYWQPPA